MRIIPYILADTILCKKCTVKIYYYYALVLVLAINYISDVTPDFHFIESILLSFVGDFCTSSWYAVGQVLSIRIKD